MSEPLSNVFAPKLSNMFRNPPEMDETTQEKPQAQEAAVFT